MAPNKLPQIITDYFQSSTKKNVPDIASCFKEQAVIQDEGKFYRGTQDIYRWLQHQATLDFKIKVLSTNGESNTYVVLANLSGNFPPPNPITITYEFKISDGKIAELYIQ